MSSTFPIAILNNIDNIIITIVLDPREPSDCGVHDDADRAPQQEQQRGSLPPDTLY